VELARRLDISSSYLSEIESCTKTPGLDLLEQYAAVFRMPVSSILLFSEQLTVSKPGGRFKAKVTSKVLKMLEWIAEKEAISNGRKDCLFY
jgi:transcriptional regulator with XRE-family HTH domain